MRRLWHEHGYHVCRVVCDATATLTPKLWLNLGYAVLLTGLFYGLSRYGLLGVAGAVVIGEVIRTVLYLLLMRRVLNVTVGQVLGSYVPGLLAGVAVAAGIAATRFLLPAGTVPAAVLLVAEILTGALLLAGLAVGAPPARLRTVLRRLLSSFQGGSSSDGRFSGLLHAFSRRLARLDGEVTPVPVSASAPTATPPASLRPHSALLPDPETELV
ncbi:hypothetical protein MUN84_19080 [Hymenobacter sp. 5516J-16]|uniref:hypothetical protein n=1 Tax=Hymenobacter sp. 5516J-16 TaxID=2932253 RepID=UPI001FD1A1FF|nr:hypothetical protein [Hymenobacter sp. 5516J-16]UOQ76609.1 hypothetical protein MUN84_19080 [Hymenobacter sp. 5516J-16]